MWVLLFHTVTLDRRTQDYAPKLLCFKVSVHLTFVGTPEYRGTGEWQMHSPLYIKSTLWCHLFSVAPSHKPAIVYRSRGVAYYCIL